MLPIFIDIDGTLTDSDDRFANVIPSRVRKVREMIEEGYDVVVWSGKGGSYARTFCEMNGLDPLAAIGKPYYCIDDNPHIRPELIVHPPELLDPKQ